MISRDMTIDDIFSKHPQKAQKLAQELTNRGLACVGCQASTWETLEAGMYGHGFSDEELEGLMERLNAILSEESDMGTISLTERAAEKFKAILLEDGKESWGLRFGDKPGGCGGFEYVLDFAEKANEDDETFMSHGVPVYVQKEGLERLLGSEIDYQEGLMGAGFKISNPQVKSSCSCGSSQNY